MASNTRGASLAAFGDSASVALGADVNNAPIAPTVIKYRGQFFEPTCPNPFLFLLRLFFTFFFDLSLMRIHLP